MIICLIEFEILPGMEKHQQSWLEELMPRAEKMPGFLSKESYSHVSGDGRISTISLWKDEKSLLAWTREPMHQRAMQEGKEKIFSRYNIRICREIRDYSYSANGIEK